MGAIIAAMDVMDDARETLLLHCRVRAMPAGACCWTKRLNIRRSWSCADEDERLSGCSSTRTSV